MNKLGFIGMGNMAQALVTGFTESGMIKASDIYAYAPHQNKLKGNAKKYGFNPCASLTELVSAADTLIMACKPYQIEAVLDDIGKAIKGKTLISIAAGWNFARYHAILGDSVHIQFVMPNTPAMVGEGVLLFEEDNSLESKEREEIIKLFSSVGTVEELPTQLMEIGSAVAGCAPAFVDMFVEAYATVVLLVNSQ